MKRLVRWILANTLYCSRCGHGNPPGTHYCGNCGGMLNP